MNNQITFELTSTERERIEDLADDYGLDANELTRRIVLAYLDHEFDNPEQLEGELPEDQVDVVEEFRQSWRDALAGKGIPIEELWKSLDDE